jgi:cytochrome P450
MLMEARDRESGQGMPDRQLVSEIMTLIVAGHETTASTLNWTWYLLSQNSEVEERLSRELNHLLGSELPELGDLPKFTYTRQVMEEALRLYPPGWLMTRKALKDDQLGDYFVPAGTEIYISPYLIQRHPALWHAPDRFNPDRFGSDQSRDRHPLTMLAFSAGPRKCIGDFFARIEMELHLIMIAKRLRLRYADARPAELDASVNLRSKCDFVMTPEIKVQRALSGHNAA